MDSKEISPAVIARLPRYLRYLGELKDEGIERVSSQELSALMHVTASQIRQDFNNFGGFGQQGYGYKVAYLYDEIGAILGLNQTHRMILIGAGNLGQALVNYMNFERRGFFFKGIFDVKEGLFGTQIRGIPVSSMKEMPDFVRKNGIDIAVLTVPKMEAPALATQLVDCGIRGIWNFAHVDLSVPAGVQVENVHLSDSLMRLSYRINEGKEK